ncbi:MAG: ABC transporter permease [Blautia sp.]|uniref:nickel ABC transporter permease n=1 Tax=Blautia sp. OF03-15BH TaxID=2292287 RepID=UPI001FA85430|nr:nickel ABC transporter permease [Blautia sp. OF03-15BH]MCI5858692.1 ABC transporter permease [Blautia sp.]MDD5965789.1 ABC transporter permease [Blautia sp.]MDY2897215.1 nickel ABC transporter permease [Candidatus Limivivens sp.]
MKQNRWIKRMLHAGIQTLILLVGITFLSFLLSWLSPGDAAERMLKKSGMMVTEEQLEAKREELGIDQPLLVQYKNWLVKLCKGDLGTSYKSKKEVVQELAKNLPYTAALTAVAMILVILISLPVGILCAQHRNGLFDNIWRGVTYLFSSLPSFFVALLLMYVLALKLGLLPVIATRNWKGILMPALVLALTLSAWYIRQVRAIVLKELSKGYIDGLKSRGISRRKILFGHVLKNSMLPLVTLFGISIGNMMGGTTIVESIFSWPGVGKMAVDAINYRDYPVIQGYVVWMALIFLVINFAVDASYQFFDPRVRKGVEKDG